MMKAMTKANKKHTSLSPKILKANYQIMSLRMMKHHPISGGVFHFMPLNEIGVSVLHNENVLGKGLK